LDDDNAAVRAAALQAIGNFDLQPEELRPFLAKALQDNEADVRRQALMGVRKLGRQGTILIPDLILVAAGEGQNNFLRRSLQRYERYGTDPRSVPELIVLLDHERSGVRQMAIRFLGFAGPAASDAVARLEAFQNDENEEVRAAAAEAIARINGDPVTERRSRRRNRE
jgi:HEAT repeat protein